MFTTFSVQKFVWFGCTTHIDKNSIVAPAHIKRYSGIQAQLPGATFLGHGVEWMCKSVFDKALMLLKKIIASTLAESSLSCRAKQKVRFPIWRTQ